jgi:hypothetical protein
MPAAAHSLILRIYHGREYGMMVIGTAEALGQLGTQLQAASSARENPRIPDWPTVVADPEVTGPYLREKNFKLSFHVLREAQLPSGPRAGSHWPLGFWLW